MSRFHFDESAADSVETELKGIVMRMAGISIFLQNAELLLIGSEGFDIGYITECINDEKKKLNLCGEKIQNGVNILNYVRERVLTYSNLANAKNINPFENVDTDYLNHKVAEYGHDFDRQVSGIYQSISRAVNLDFSNPETQGLWAGLNATIENLGVDEENYKILLDIIDGDIINDTKDFASMLKKIWSYADKTGNEYLKRYAKILGRINNVQAFSKEGLAILGGKYIAVQKYLDTMSETYETDSVLQLMVESMRFTYEDQYGSFVIWSLGYGTKKGVDYLLSKVGEKAFGSYLSGVGYSLDLSGKILGFDDLDSAYRKLDGMEILRYENKKAYDTAWEKLQSSRYTQEDIDNANNLFDVYKQTLITEYETMIEIEKFKYENESNYFINPGKWAHRDEIKANYDAVVKEYNDKIAEIRSIENPIGALSN